MSLTSKATSQTNVNASTSSVRTAIFKGTWILKICVSICHTLLRLTPFLFVFNTLRVKTLSLWFSPPGDAATAVPLFWKADRKRPQFALAVDVRAVRCVSARRRSRTPPRFCPVDPVPSNRSRTSAQTRGPAGTDRRFAPLGPEAVKFRRAAQRSLPAGGDASLTSSLR